MAYDWIVANVPPGARIAIESRKLILRPHAYQAENMVELRQKTYDTFVADGVEYLVASSQRYGPYLSSTQIYPVEYSDYMRIFGQSRELVRFTPSDKVPGPELRIFKVKP
jgi:hypothetical protein